MTAGAARGATEPVNRPDTESAGRAGGDGTARATAATPGGPASHQEASWQETIDHVASLARLHLAPGERAALAGQLGRILEYVDQLRALDTTGVPPTMTAVPLANAFREDEPRQCLSREEVLSNAPDAVGPVFRVPRVIE